MTRAEETGKEVPADRPPTMVALGASAGGLAVFERFLQLVPKGANLAFLLVSHLDPSQESLLTELLAPHTDLAVAKAEDGEPVEADHVYVIPPNSYMTVEGGVIRLREITEPRGARFPIDALLASLAEDQKENAVGIILTGTGADGTDGLRAIKDHGGTVIVQDPQTVEYAGMPTSAIATGIVDFVLPVEQMPNVLVGYARHFYPSGRAPEPSAGTASSDLEDVLAVLKAHGDRLDYRAYKPGTLLRRIHRRMGLAQIDSTAEYIEFLRKEPDEIERLRVDLLITVTHFFRDPEAWRVIEDQVVPALFQERSAEMPTRVWVSGCSTGEEAYSIAMLLIDHRRALQTATPIQVFATDLKPSLIEVARAGLYDKSSVAHVPAERLARYFTQEGPHQYRATKELRETIAFAEHDLLTDPPFSRMDLVICRNVLIYFQPEAQKRLIGLFHFALRQGGFLFLGGSEGVASHERDFEPLSKKWRVYRRTGRSNADNLGASAAAEPASLDQAEFPPTRSRVAATPARAAGIADTALRWLVDAYAPAAVVIDQNFDIVYIHGSLGTYLELPRGEPDLNLLAMISTLQRGRLRVALHEARSSRETREVTLAYEHPEKPSRAVRLRISPFAASSHREPLMIVTFEDVRAQLPPEQMGAPPTPEEESAIGQLEAELAATRNDLQGTIEALETANEDLRASNEEIMSMNEEFRSTNEELETSKEELQSLNEELGTVNSQLREKVSALERVTNDLTNFLASTDIPTIFLDSRLHIRRFTPASKAVLNLIPSDVDRPLADISLKVQDEALVEDIHEVSRSLTPLEKEIRSQVGRRYLRRIRPYRTHEDRMDGVVITYVDIEQMKAAEDKLFAAGRYAEEIVETVREPLIVLDAQFRVKRANRAFYDRFEQTPEDTTGRSIYSLSGGQWDVPALRGLLGSALRERTDVRDFEMEADLQRLGKRTMLVNSRRLPLDPVDGEERILLAIEDVTESVADRERLRARTSELEKANENLLHVNESLKAFSHVVGHDLKEPARGVDALLHVLQEDHGALLPPAGQKLLADARVANQRLSRLIGGLLALSRATQIDFPQLRAVGIAESVESEACRTRFETLLASRRGILEPPNPDVFVHATPESLCQILGNLVLNAVKYNPRSEPRVIVRAAPARREGMVEIVVEDNGPGFPAELVAGFENMSSTTRGFGLMIARRTVENLGGRMWLESAEGGGAVHFTLRAPPRT